MTVKILTPWRDADSQQQFRQVVEFLSENVAPKIDLLACNGEIATSAYAIDRKTCKTFWIIRRKFDHCVVWTIPADYETLLALKYGVWSE